MLGSGPRLPCEWAASGRVLSTSTPLGPLQCQLHRPHAAREAFPAALHTTDWSPRLSLQPSPHTRCHLQVCLACLPASRQPENKDLTDRHTVDAQLMLRRSPAFSCLLWVSQLRSLKPQSLSSSLPCVTTPSKVGSRTPFLKPPPTPVQGKPVVPMTDGRLALGSRPAPEAGKPSLQGRWPSSCRSS